MRLDRQQVNGFQRLLVAWYETHGRDLPWRRTRQPYRILVSEIMLQQTQVERVRHYYGRFLRRYPSFDALAAAAEPEVREAWDGLGYYARARNLHRTARLVVHEHGGRLPDDPALMRSLPGIGRYTAGALSSIAFGKDAAILDTNAARVLARVFAISASGSKSQLQRRLWEVAERVTPSGRAAAFNQAIMDLGATICRARAPECPDCPVRSVCRVGRGRSSTRARRRAGGARRQPRRG